MSRVGSSTIRGTATSVADGARLTIMIVSLAALLVPCRAAAQERCPRPVARVHTVTNRVQILQISTRAPLPATAQSAVCAGETIQVGDNSRAHVLIVDSNLLLTLDQNSEMVVPEPAPATSPSYVDLLRGALLFLTRVRRSFEVRTPFVNASVEGTEFVVRIQDDRTVLTVLEGTVRASNPYGMLLVEAGQQAVTVSNQAPQLQVIIRPRDAVQWALYYEPVLPRDSFEQLAQVPPAAQDAAFYVRRASLLLGAGQLDEARADLDLAQKLDPSNGDAYALRAIVAVALNDKTAALENGRLAVERSPRSTAAKLSLSYALQSNFELEAARETVEEAVAAESNNAAAWARLAELRLMLDDVGGAADAAERAAMIAPDLARPRVVRGFTSLAQINLSDAEESFERALTLEPGNPLARLGLGLARIRQGHLSTGRSDLEVAAALSPNDAIVRSYLGKAYFDERNDTAAAQEFQAAQRLDPPDPTPFLLDAIRKETLHRPIEALQDFQTSIALNDNRAVYRSRFLLDSDLAVRGARLGRIYRDLGFENVALIEGWKSLNADSSNASAHRLLADNYLGLPGHEIARDSELLQSQLLQTVNINPVQPRLASNGIGLLTDTGVSGVGYNEFTRMFATNQVRFVGDVLAGTQNAWAGNFILSGVLDRLSYSAGTIREKTDGIRDNNDRDRSIHNVFFQADLSHADSAQIELRWTDLDQGDPALFFNPESFSREYRADSQTRSVRLGGRHVFSPRSMLIGSYVHRRLDSDFTVDATYRVVTEEPANFAEIRYLWNTRVVNLTAGSGLYRGQATETTTLDGTTDSPLAVDVRHTSGYVYLGSALRSTFTVTTGVSIESFDDGDLNRKSLNPKFGVTWTPTPATTVRGAVLRALKRPLISSQTIEPTQVAGFNQFFDDINATDSWRYGVAVEHRIADRAFTGVEVSRRQLTSPLFSRDARESFSFDTHESLARGYLHATPNRWLALSTEYRFQRLLRDALISEGLLSSNIHSLVLEGRVFSRSGFFARLKGRLIAQEGSFLNLGDGEPFSGSDTFVTTDGTVGFHLPRNLGVVSVEGRHLFDNKFVFQDVRAEQSTIIPRRMVVSRLTVVF